MLSAILSLSITCKTMCRRTRETFEYCMEWEKIYRDILSTNQSVPGIVTIIVLKDRPNYRCPFWGFRQHVNRETRKEFSGVERLNIWRKTFSGCGEIGNFERISRVWRDCIFQKSISSVERLNIWGKTFSGCGEIGNFGKVFPGCGEIGYFKKVFPV